MREEEGRLSELQAEQDARPRVQEEVRQKPGEGRLSELKAEQNARLRVQGEVRRTKEVQ
jgi:hypothetical protein